MENAANIERKYAESQSNIFNRDFKADLTICSHRFSPTPMNIVFLTCYCGIFSMMFEIYQDN